MPERVRRLAQLGHDQIRKIDNVVNRIQPDRLEPGASRELLVTVAVAEDAIAGAYHGQLLVEGLADVVFPLRVRGLPTTSHSS